MKESGQGSIDKILDKINLVGYENLSNYEKSLLDRYSNDDYNYGSIEEEVVDWLNKTYGQFIVDEFIEKSFGRFINKGFNFLSNDLMLMMKLVTKVGDRIENNLYVNHEIYNDFGKNFDLTEDEEMNILKQWLSKNHPEFDFDSYNFRLLF